MEKTPYGVLQRIYGWGRVGGVPPDLQILTLFQNKKCRYSHPFLDLAFKK